MSANASESESYDKSNAANTLTPEELAAMNDDGLSDEDRAVMQKLAGKDDDGEGAEDNAEDNAEDAGAAAAIAAPSADAVVADIPAESDEGYDNGPVYETALPDDLSDRTKSLDAKEDELSEKFKNGDIDASEFIAETRKISSARREIDRIETEVSVAQKINSQNAHHQWMRAVTDFMKEAKSAEGIDYATDETKGKQFDLFVRAIANDPANSDKPYKWFLQQAHKATKAVLGIVDKPIVKQSDGKPSGRKPPVDHVPANLSQVPGSDGPGDVSGNEFDEIDRLNGIAYELALAKLTPSQRERYLLSA